MPYWRIDGSNGSYRLKRRRTDGKLQIEDVGKDAVMKGRSLMMGGRKMVAQLLVTGDLSFTVEQRGYLPFFYITL